MDPITLSALLPVIKGAIGGGGGGGGGGKAGAAGAITGLATGLIQTVQAGKLKKKADAAMPDLVDPNQAAYLAELNQKRKSIETGADFTEAMQQADTSQASTNDALLKSSGGNIGATIQALLQSQSVAGDVKNKALAQGQAQQFNWDTAYGSQLNKIATTKRQLQLYDSQQKRAEWAQKKQTASQNVNAGISGLLGVMGQKKGDQGMAPPPATPPIAAAATPAMTPSQNEQIPGVPGNAGELSYLLNLTN